MNPREMMAIESRDYRDNSSVGLKSMIEHLLEGDWLVMEIDDEPIDTGAPREVRFEGDRVVGQVGVNRFTGSFTLDGDTLQVGPIASTRMAGPPDLMALEDRFNSHLDGEHEIALKGDVVTLSREAHSIVLTHAPSLPAGVAEPG
jgi:heat shock protein HslJ